MNTEDDIKAFLEERESGELATSVSMEWVTWASMIVFLLCVLGIVWITIH